MALVIIIMIGGVASSAGAARRPRHTRVVGIYSAVIRELVVDDNTDGGAGSGFDAIYVIDGPVENAADPTQQIDDIRAQDPFPPKIIKALRAELEDLPDMTFVDDRTTVVTGPAPGRVIGNGVLLTLGELPRGSRRVEVEASLWINGLAGQWLTYVVERDAGTWLVTGTTGPVAIS